MILFIWRDLNAFRVTCDLSSMKPERSLGDHTRECDNTCHFCDFGHVERHLTKKEHKNHEISTDQKRA